MRNPSSSSSSDGTKKITPCCSKVGLLRCGKSCRLRWMNYLRPSIKRGHIAPDEEDLILRLHRLLGNRWSLIAGRIPGRTDNGIKNYWNTRLRKKLISQGIDPTTHKPLIFNQVVLHDQLASSSSTSNPNTPSLEIMEEAGVSSTHQAAAANFTTNYNIPIDGGFMMGSLLPSSHGHGYNCIDDYIDNCDEDTFSSFLDSLVNDDDFMNHINEQQQQ
ncbi:hypothetical protein WN944_016421 [Citrus x changshan-huyou]|uniref:Uncharacterized protein n=1 Tax=Citrus x changshan-huyou TaxID=2935761 RepID=A0AAP0MEB8_9ROSI